MSKGTGMLRERNTKRILSLIRRYKKTSRQDLVEYTGLSKNTISLIVDELMNQNILKEIGVKQSASKGRPKIMIAVNKQGYKSIGIGISSQLIEYAVVNYYGEIIESETITFINKDANLTKKKLLSIIESLEKKYNHILGVAIGMPGLVDTQRNILYSSIHLGWVNVSFADFQVFNFPLYIQNNVNMSALNAIERAEQEVGDNTFYVSIGDGVGGTVIIDNYILNGASGTAGEIGHISIDPTADQCSCGQSGCLEVLINYKALQKNIDAMGYPCSPANIMRAPEWQQSEAIKNTMYKFGVYLGEALVQVIHLINPNNILIDSPYGMSEDFSYGCLDYLNRYTLKFPYQQTKLTFDKGKYSTSVGAGLFCIINYERFE